MLIAISDEESVQAQAQKEQADLLLRITWITVAAVLSVSIIITIVIIALIRKAILVPMRELEAVAKEMADGNLHAPITYDGRDEMGSLADSMKTMTHTIASYITDISDRLGQISDGDLRVDVDLDYIGDFAPIKSSMERIVTSLNEAFGQIGESARQVAGGSEQVSSGAQMLSQGSSEQASSIEELAATIAHISLPTRCRRKPRTRSSASTRRCSTLLIPSALFRKLPAKSD